MILKEIAMKTVQRVAELKKRRSLDLIMKEAGAMPAETGFPFEKALSLPDVSFICEVKKASPSKGVIDRDFPYLSIAKEYEAYGASAISVLTEPCYFMGSDKYLVRIAETVGIPVLRKDFVVDPYQIYEAKCLGASAVLLICTLLDIETLSEYIELANELGLSALVEAHTEVEVESALKAGARIIGINNRNLSTFEVDIRTSVRLRGLVPEDILFVSESGIKTAGDIELLRENNVDAVLIGETLMRSNDKKRQLAVLRGNI